jgi:hypothetical protein
MFAVKSLLGTVLGVIIIAVPVYLAVMFRRPAPLVRSTGLTLGEYIILAIVSFLFGLGLNRIVRRARRNAQTRTRDAGADNSHLPNPP